MSTCLNTVRLYYFHALNRAQAHIHTNTNRGRQSAANCSDHRARADAHGRRPRQLVASQREDAPRSSSKTAVDSALSASLAAIVPHVPVCRRGEGGIDLKNRDHRASSWHHCCIRGPLSYLTRHALLRQYLPLQQTVPTIVR